MEDDHILRRISKPVTEIDDKIIQLLEDMEQTMRHHNGVGLAAVQVGSLKRIVVFDVSDDGDELVEMINPVIISTEGTQQNKEGCLSIKASREGYFRSGLVDRPEKTVVRAMDRFGKEFEIEAEGFKSIALNHEIDHLNGVLYTDKAHQMYEEAEEDDDESDTPRARRRRKRHEK